MLVRTQAVVTHPVVDSAIARISADGTLLCVVAAREIEIHDLITGRFTCVAMRARRVALVGDEVWALTAGEVVTLHRFARNGAQVGAPLALAIVATPRLSLTSARSGVAAAVVQGLSPLLLVPLGDAVEIREVGSSDGMVIPIGRSAWLERHGERLDMRCGAAPPRPLEIPAAVLHGAAVVGGAALLGGTLAALELRGGEVGHSLCVIDLLTGVLIDWMRLESVRQVVLVENRGHALLVRGPRDVTVLDLATHQCVAECAFESEIEDLAVDALGRQAAVMRRRGDGALVVDIMDYETFAENAR